MLHLLLLPALVSQDAAPRSLEKTAEQIHAAATAPNRGEEGRPLPLFASWNTGGVGEGFTPTWQMAMLDKGHRLLPWFALERPDSRLEPHQIEALQQCAKLGLPV